jgi:hypothetical protein
MAFVLMVWAHSAWSYTVSGTTYTTNGSQSDVQAACNAAPDNGSVTVLIPNGTYSWTGNLNITKSLTLAGQSATGVIIQNNNSSGDMIDVTSSVNGNTNIYWLDLQQITNEQGGLGFMITADRTEPSSYTVLIHDCILDTRTNFQYAVNVEANGIVFWNDTFPATGSGALNLTGITFACNKYGYTSSWNTPDSYGTQDATGLMNSYVENCSFRGGASYCVDFDTNSRVVFRYNTVQDSVIGSHGQESSPAGCREWEIYDNTFNITSGNPEANQAWFSDRGGAGVIWGNSMAVIGGSQVEIQFCVFSISIPGQIPCQTGYPAARQLGQGWSSSSTAPYGNPVVSEDGTGAVTEGIYIWNNNPAETQDPNFVGLNQYPTDQCGNGQNISKYVVAGRDYFVGTAKAGYTPYTYPHPRHTQYLLSGSPSSSPSATPTPTPTPIPAPAAPQDLRVVTP